MNLTGKSVTEMLPSPNVALSTARALGRALAAPHVARDHPLARDLRTFLANDYEIVDFTLANDPPSVEVVVRRDEDVRRIQSSDLAFVTYAATAVPRAQSRARAKAGKDGGLS